MLNRGERGRGNKMPVQSGYAGLLIKVFGLGGDDQVVATHVSLNNLLMEQMDALLLTLRDRECRVLQLRFGLEDGRSRLLQEIGDDFGLSRERIRQIEAKALRKLRHPSRSNRLKPFLSKGDGEASAKVK